MTKTTDSFHQKLERRFASIDDLEIHAQKRLPKFAFDYLQGGTGQETAIARNRSSLNNIQLIPHHMVEPFEPQLKTSLLGRTWSAPYGIAPLGLSGLIWPDAAKHFARTAQQQNIPTVLSTVATTKLETIAQLAPDTAWFQLYIPNDDAINRSIIERAKTAGYKTLVVTIDVPALGRRARDIKNGLAVPPKITFKNIIQGATHPTWALSTLKAGIPDFETLAQYVPKGTDMRAASQYVSALARGHVSMDKLQKVRDLWPGNLVVKGILNEIDAASAKQVGCDGIIISNHGGRQLDAAPAPITIIKNIRREVGAQMPIIADSGVRSGLDIARLMAHGADFVLLGRAFGYSVAALGERGPDHAHYILSQELKNVLSQLGCKTPQDLPRVGLV